MPCLKPPKREGECAPSVRKGRCWVALHWAGTARAASPLDGDARTCTTEPEETKHPILQRRRLVAERSSVRGWQDLRAVRDSRGPCSESGPFMARSSRGVSPNGGLRGFSDAWRAYPAKASSFRMHGARILPRKGAFPVRGHFRDAWSAKLATDCRPGTHFASIFPSASARERTVVKSCHGKALGNAPHEYIATASQAKNASGRNPATIGRWERISRAFCHRRAPGERISATSCQQNGIFVRAGLLPCHSSRTA